MAARSRGVVGISGREEPAVVAGYFWGEDQNEVDEAVHRGVEGELDRIIKSEEGSGQRKEGGNYISGTRQAALERTAGREVDPTNCESLFREHQENTSVGHDLIFASIAIRALDDHPECATPTIVGGIQKLIKGFNGVTAPRGNLSTNSH